MEVFRSGDPMVFEAYFSFIVSGCVGLVQYWLQGGLKETPEQMALPVFRRSTRNIPEF